MCCRVAKRLGDDAIAIVFSSIELAQASLLRSYDRVSVRSIVWLVSSERTVGCCLVRWLANRCWVGGPAKPVAEVAC